ncbi:FAD-dependent oxidoreductase [Chelatococcus sp. SYSU_G07232]|uniref:FAD-dependent oxidoreductase n=1 Tax=Chelatococcus albus TaxID=3047466 RepID=A0ABT7AH44_9HYPH|nr:FAD-dependent oxidoreductase [Chelatococcus sp. SYSU_G07232]MDJ1158690.1 FAD-dependent oxidoreductase [Chelatococcus sp. SYSU_G07232]
MTASIRPVVVGAGPAGVRAAQTLVAAGLRPVVVDEAPAWGGQIYRQQPPGFTRPKRALYGFEVTRAKAVHAAMAAIRDRVDYRPHTLVWNAEGERLDLLSDGRAATLTYTHLILATGATDRVLPFPGWTTPGVYTLGGAQVALKFQGCGIGRRVAFLGTGPLLYLVAYQYARAGAAVAAVLDTAPFTAKLQAAPGMLRLPAVFAKGLWYLAWLKARGIPVRSGVRPLQVEGEARATGLLWREGTRERRVACDAVAFGYGLRSETQLADLLGCRFAFDALDRAYLPVRDAAGRTSVPHVYVAGDGAGVMGADAAERAGERAALALLQDIGTAVDGARALHLERELGRIQGFRRALERAFPVPADWAANVPDDLVICRCEEVRAGELRAATREAGAREMNRLKALTRVGMGRCQGRMCGTAAAEILAQACDTAPEAVGRLRGQPPVKPLPVALARHVEPEEVGR